MSRASPRRQFSGTATPRRFPGQAALFPDEPVDVLFRDAEERSRLSERQYFAGTRGSLRGVRCRVVCARPFGFRPHSEHRTFLRIVGNP